MKGVWALAEQALKQGIVVPAKPILKWAGGKTQMLGDLLPKVPSSYGRYIEPFLGGGAMFFALQPEQAVIADSNPELINLYRQVANHVDDVVCQLKNMRIHKKCSMRSGDKTGQCCLKLKQQHEQFS